ncbi:VCBS domain-containing protein, partial [Aeromonas bivalvium]|uniref:VCBS domain-containing protein n=1 Tax=Aeromonas bivalvium TaxID=440079 RepID=UPI0038D1E236
VQALRLAGDTLSDSFSYTMTDAAGATSSASLVITLQGANDAPVAQNNIAIAVADNGAGNVSNPSGNLLTNDGDVDGGDSLTLTAGRTGEEGAGGPLAPVTQGNPLVLVGQYGTLTLLLDGSYQYALDTGNAAVLGLGPLQTLSDHFTYQAQDLAGAVDLAQLTIIIRGRNDAPVANPDQALVIEAGGLNNAQPGLDPSGNVLGNDTDLEGDPLTVTGVQNANGQSASLGTVLRGRYGDLVMNADGSWHYRLDNSLAEVQALRGPNQTLTEVFDYQIADIWGVGSASTLTLTIRGSNDTPIAVDDQASAIEAGGVSQARLTIVIQGANDNPVARDDSAVANDQVQPPHTSGNVLPNDGDVDANDPLRVTAVRTGTEQGGGNGGTLGQPLAGRYGWLTLNGDGSYRYTIDLTNREVLAAAGLGQVLQDVFTYTLGDGSDATDLAQLTINLDISAPYVPPPDSGVIGPHQLDRQFDGQQQAPLPDITPAIFVTPVVQRVSLGLDASGDRSDGSQLFFGLPPEIRSQSIGQGLGQIAGTFVGQSVLESALAQELDLASFLGRHGRVDLNADGLLSDESLFALTPQDMKAPSPQGERPLNTNSFTRQLQDAAGRPAAPRGDNQPFVTKSGV